MVKNWALQSKGRWIYVYFKKQNPSRKLLIEYENDNKNWAVHDSSIWLKGNYFKTRSQAFKFATDYMRKN